MLILRNQPFSFGVYALLFTRLVTLRFVILTMRLLRLVHLFFENGKR